MKKKSIITAIFLAVAIVFSSCADFLDTRSQSEFDASIIFSDPVLAEGALMGAYFVLGYNNSYRNRNMVHTFTNADTEIHREALSGIDETGRRAMAIFNISPNMGSDIVTSPSMFCFAYQAIERLNLVIDGIPRYGNLNNPAMQHILGEALALRAFFYFDLIKWYGDVPARFEPLTGTTILVPREDRDIIYIQILDDLVRAAELLPWPGQPPYNRVDRMNQAFARAFRARVALHAGGYSLRNDNGQAVIRRSTHPELERRAMYEIARHETSVLMANEGNGFMFSPNFEQIFRDNVAEVVSVGRESIFELPYSPGERGQWLAFFGARHLGPNDRFTATHIRGEAGPTAIMWYWFDNNDIRRDVSIVHHVYAAATPTTAQQIIQAASNTPSIRTAYFGKLRAEWGNRRVPSNDDGIKPIIMRYADVLLMFAEAENFLNGPTDAARNALRRVRARAFPTGDPLNIDALSQEQFFHAIMDERAFEFLGEQRRKYDLNRWGMLRERLVWAQNQTRRMRDEGAGITNGEWGAPTAPRDIDFRGYPRHIFWRNHTVDPGLIHVEIFGLRRGEFPRDENGQIIEISVANNGQPTFDEIALNTWAQTFDGGGWNRYVGTHSGDNPPNPLEWIDRRNTSDGHPLSEWFIVNGFFMPGPNDLTFASFAGGSAPQHRLTLEQRSLLPIWSVPLSTNRYLENFPWWD